MPNYYIDLVSGNDANDGLGPYKAAYTSGGTTAIAVGDTVTGGTSGRTAKVVNITVTSGSWAGGDAAGSIYVGTPSGAFTNGEALLVGGGDRATLTADFVVSSWLTVASGATAARVAPGDEIRIKKTLAAASQGNAAFTKRSATVTMASAKWKNICNCDDKWTASANITQSNSTSKKEGSYCQQFIFASGFSTGKVAYYDLGSDQDLSDYENISLWINVSADIAGSTFRIDLCSDTAGDTPVDAGHQFTITHYLGHDTISGGWNRVLLKKGSALGTVRSIALYALLDPGTPTVRLDNIVACNQIHHLSLVGKNEAKLYGVLVLGTDGVTITLENAYYGDTAAAAALYSHYDYIPSTLLTSLTYAHEIKEAGTSGSPTKYRFGWNFSDDVQDGYTYTANIGDKIGRGLGVLGYTRVECCILAYFAYGYYAISASADMEFKNIKAICTNPMYTINSSGGTILKLEGTDNVFIGNASYLELTRNSGSKAIVWTGDIFCQGGAATGAPLRFQGFGVRIKGEITVYSTGGYGPISFEGEAGSYVFKKLTLAPDIGQWLLLTSSAGPTVYIEHLVIDVKSTGQTNYMAYATGSSGRLGRIIVGRCTELDGTVSFEKTTYAAQGESLHDRFSIDNYKTEGRFIGNCMGGSFGDHITMGQAADWAYGGTGLSLVLNPVSTTVPIGYEVFIPATASKTYTLSLQVRKTSSDANCTLVYDLMGCGITSLYDQSVTLTDSWAEHVSSEITTTIGGWIRLEFRALDGSTTGDIGIDEIKLEEV